MKNLTHEQIKTIRERNQGCAFGVKLTPYASDLEISQLVRLKDLKADLYNSVFARSKRGPK